MTFSEEDSSRENTVLLGIWKNAHDIVSTSELHTCDKNSAFFIVAHP